MMVLPFILGIFFGSQSFGDYVNLKIRRISGPNNVKQFCYSPIEDLSKSTCLRIIPIIPFNISTEGQRTKFTQIRVEELALDADSKAVGKTEFEVTVSWKGKGAGMLAISGPGGRLFVFGKVIKMVDGAKPYQIKIETFTDESLAQQLDRGTVFGEAEPLRLDAMTENWLQQTVAPALEKYFNERGKGIDLSPK